MDLRSKLLGLFDPLTAGRTDKKTCNEDGGQPVKDPSLPVMGARKADVPFPSPRQPGCSGSGAQQAKQDGGKRAWLQRHRQQDCLLSLTQWEGVWSWLSSQTEGICNV